MKSYSLARHPTPQHTPRHTPRHTPQQRGITSTRQLLLGILVVAAGLAVGCNAPDDGAAEEHGILADVRAQRTPHRVWSEARLEPIRSLVATADGPLYRPGYIYADPAGGSALVIDYDDMIIKEIDSTGAFVRSFGAGVGQGPGEFVNPTAVTIARDSVYVADGVARMLSVFERSGRFVLKQTLRRGIFRVVPARPGSVIGMDAFGEDGAFYTYSYGSHGSYRSYGSDSSGIVDGVFGASFGKLIEEPTSNGMKLDGTLATDGQYIYYLPFRLPFLFCYSLDGDLRWAVATIGSHSTSETATPESSTAVPGVRVVRSSAMHSAVSVVGSELFVHSRRSDTTPDQSDSILDVYDAETGRYLRSYDLGPVWKGAVTDGRYVYARTDTSVTVLNFETDD